MSEQAIPIPANCHLENESPNDLETTPSDVAVSNRKKALGRLALGAGLLIFCAFMNPFGPTPFSLPERLQSYRVVTGWWIYLCFLLTWIVGVPMALWGLWTFVRPIRAGSSPAETMRQFFQDVTDDFDSHMPLAWCSLLKSARSEFPEGLKQFEKDWWDHSNKRRGHVRVALSTAKKNVPDQIRLAVKSVTELVTRTPFSVVEAVISSGGVDWKEVRVLASLGGRWYLVDGKCYDDTPPNLVAFVNQTPETKHRT